MIDALDALRKRLTEDEIAYNRALDTYREDGSESLIVSYYQAVAREDWSEASAIRAILGTREQSMIARAFTRETAY